MTTIDLGIFIIGRKSKLTLRLSCLHNYLCSLDNEELGYRQYMSRYNTFACMNQCKLDAHSLII